jgi:hypothetical protein
MARSALGATVDKMLDAITEQDKATGALISMYQAEQEKFVQAMSDGVTRLNGMVAEIQNGRRTTILLQSQIRDVLQLMEEQRQTGNDGEEWKRGAD